jgi:hypothetical protein
MRCLVKCLSLFGLGWYIYAGEDVPQARAQANKEWNENVTEPATQEYREEKQQEEQREYQTFHDGLVDAVIKMADSKLRLQGLWTANISEIEGMRLKDPELYESLLEAFKQQSAVIEEQ